MTTAQLVSHLEMAHTHAKATGDKARASHLLGRLIDARKAVEREEKSAKIAATTSGQAQADQDLAEDIAEATREESARSPIVLKGH